MRIDSTDFELFAIEPRFRLDPTALDERWRALQAEVHPDKFVAQGASAQRLAMQWAVRVNEAFRRLRDPLTRAAYLCELRGAKIEAESNTAMPTDFLVQQMQWREALDDASAVAEVEVLAQQVERHRTEALEALGRTLDEQHDPAAAAQQVRALMFVERFAADIDGRLEAQGH